MLAAHSAIDPNSASRHEPMNEFPGSVSSRQLGVQKVSSKRGISRTAINFCLDALLLVTFLTLVWISFVLRFVFPQATVASGWSVWGNSYDNWAAAQFNVLMVLSVGILVHVMLHWSWVCGVITSRLKRHDGKPVRWEDGTRTLVGVGLIVVIVNILGILLACASLTSKPPM